MQDLVKYKLYTNTGKFLFENLKKAFDKGRKFKRGGNSKIKFSKVKFSKEDDFFGLKKDYSGIEKGMLRNFLVECFSVAAVSNYELEERLKNLAADLMTGMGENDIKDEWVREAKKIIPQYNYTGEEPPEGYLRTNLRTAVTGAYHGSIWNQVQGAGIYNALQYKTREDERVREEHARLNDKIFFMSDPLWSGIYPPNGWNCRCYTIPMTPDEVADSGISPENPTDISKVSKVAGEGGVDKEFMRNTGMTHSIWGKWLQSKLTDKVYNEITERLKGYANQMPDADEVIKNLEQTKTKLPYENLTAKNWEKAFPSNIATTPLGEFKMKGDQYQKLKDRVREYLFGAIKTTLKDPDYIIVDKKNGTLIIKSFKSSEGNIKNAVIVIEYTNGEEMIVSMHEKGNIKNKVKDSKLLIYSRSHSSSQLYSLDKQFTRTGVSLNFANSKIEKNKHKINPYGELWGEIIPGKVYKSVLRKIAYRITGIEIEVIKEGKTKSITDNYSNIDKYRTGVLIERY